MAIPIKRDTLEPSEFQRILNIGLGRAILYLQQHSASPYRDAILCACLNVTSFDPQVEGTRADYVWEILQATGESEFYKAPLLEALAGAASSPDDNYRLSHLFALALYFAEEGDHQAAEVIRQKFAENAKAGLIIGEFAVIALDGLAGLTSVFNQITAAGFLEMFEWEFEALIREAEETFGKAPTWNALQSVESEALKNYLAKIQNIPEPKNREPHKTSEEEIRAALDGGKSLPRGWREWIATAPDEIVSEFAAEVLKEQNPHHLLNLIQMFGKRDFPVAIDRLIWFSEHGDDRIDYDRMAIFAINALERITHPDVRALALRMIRNNNRLGRAVGLLQKNFEQDDWKLIAEVTKRPLDAEDYHNLGWSVRDVLEQHPSSEAGEAFINLYERGACSACRERNVEILHRLNQLPDWILEECKYDANFYLREQARNGFSSVE